MPSDSVTRMQLMLSSLCPDSVLPDQFKFPPAVAITHWYASKGFNLKTLHKLEGIFAEEQPLSLQIRIPGKSQTQHRWDMV